MKIITNWITGEDIKYLYRLNKISLCEAEGTILKRQYFILVCITTVVLLLVLLP